MMIHDITEMVGKYKARKRVGRGRGSGLGKTSGRGHKGAQSRAGHTYRAYFEGGQMTFARRIPKRGFTNAKFRNEFHIINLKALDRFENGATVDAAALVDAGLIRDDKLPVKVLGEGELAVKLTVSAHRFSRSAREKIEQAGGTVHVIEQTKWTRQSAAAKAGEKKKAEASAES